MEELQNIINDAETDYREKAETEVRQGTEGGTSAPHPNTLLSQHYARFMQR